MKVTIDELKSLRITLTAHRMEHERLVTQMRLLREHCLELRMQIATVRQLHQLRGAPAPEGMS